MPHPWKRAAVAAKVEAVPLTPEALSWSTNAIRMVDAIIPEHDFLAQNTRENAITGTLDTPEPAAPAGEFVRVPLRFPLIGAGAAYAYTNETTNVLPECHPLLRAAGMSLAVTGGAGSEKATYSQNDDPVTTITIWIEVGGKKYILTGCQAESFRTIWQAGRPVMAEGVYVGVVSSFAEQALENAVYDSFTNAPWVIFKASNSPAVTPLVIGAYQPEVQEVIVDHGLTTEPLVNANALDGHGGYKISNRSMIATVQARIVGLSTWNPKDDEITRTPRTLDLKAGLAQYKRVAFDADAAVAMNVKWTQDGNWLNYDAPYQLTPATSTGSLIFD